MSKIPPYRYGSLEQQVANRLETLQAGAPVEFDTMQEIATELQDLKTQLAALQGGINQSFLLLE